MTLTLEALRKGDLAGARSLKLDGGLTTVPDEIFGLADTLEVLDLSGNRLEALPSDMGRLKRLRVLFCSGNSFERLPEVLGECEALSQIGFRGVGLKEVPATALPPRLRWLTLTDNRIDTLPTALGERPLLQKLMLSGNRLRSLPESLGALPNLELLRVAANQLDALPSWLADLPALAWPAWGGNPFDAPQAAMDHTPVEWTDLQMGKPLGEGASGQVFEVAWRKSGETATPAALKLFKGAMTSDGLPEREMAACLAVGAHPSIVGAIGSLTGHPNGVAGLLMPLLPPSWCALAGPPSLETCSRDVYDPGRTFDVETVLGIATGVGEAAAHLHASGVVHGDLYAHNVLWDGGSQARLSDFGAACFMPPGSTTDGRRALERIEVRAWGILLGELADRCPDTPEGLRTLQSACVSPRSASRPSMAEALDGLAAVFRL